MPTAHSLEQQLIENLTGDSAQSISGKFKEIGNIHIVGVIRGNDMIPNPDEKFIFLDGDLLAVIAPDEDRHKFAALLGNAG